MNAHDDPIQRAMLRDRHALRRLQRKLTKAGPSAHSRLQSDFDNRLKQSCDQAAARRANRPAVPFENDLPIMAWREEIIQTIRAHPVCVISGETGSGKSTQLPKMCLEAGYGVFGTIGHTQPRRIAARTIAQRISQELSCPLGQSVGFKIRFNDKTDERTYIKLMTDGILLAETQRDPFLDQYEVLIIDEAHERSLNVDFLLGYLKRQLPRRPDLRVIITSATLDAERFCAHFATESGPAPHLSVSGRGYPVQTRYRPLTQTDGSDPIQPIDGIVNALEELSAEATGDVLIFLATEREIRETAKQLRNRKAHGTGRILNARTEILPLYARLTASEQNRVFQSGSATRIVLATNVAESSLTVPNIHHVIDLGTARISRYAPRSKVQRLPIEPISRASADQRQGRCGRIAPGICYRLYSEDDYESRRSYTTPEIQRTNLASVILQSQSLNLGRIEDFPFIDPPRPESLRDGHRTLFEIGATDENKRLTPLGKRLSRFPVDPRIARIILAGHEQGCLAEILIIAAALEIQDPRERPLDKQQQADAQHEKFQEEQSDFISYLKLWDFYHDQKRKLSHSRLRRACVTNFLSFHRLREWSEIHRQLMQLCQDHQMRWQARKDDIPSIHTALLTGLLSGIACRTGDYEYTGAGGVKFQLWPGSGLFPTKPGWCLVFEILETTRQYGRTVGRIQPEWVEPLAQHVLKRQYQEPHWHEKSQTVMAWETATLFGLPIVARRRVPYGPICPEEASEVFVRNGLAARNVEINDAFFQHNQRVIAQCTARADKTRDARLMVDEFVLYRFYNQRLPADVYDVATLRKWVQSDPEHRRQIQMTVEDLFPVEDALEENAYPDELEWGALRLPVQYAFSPGEEYDGATITVPEEGLAECHPGQIEWGIPGLLEKKIVAIIRSLPKRIRRGLIPAPDVARKVASELNFGQGDFLHIIVEKLSAVAGEPIAADAFRWDKIPPHLRVNIRVVDARGEMVAESRDLAEIRKQLGTPSKPPPTNGRTDTDSPWYRQNITQWDIEELPEFVTIVRNQIELKSYPTLVDRGDRVDMTLLPSPSSAERLTRAGVRRLYAFQSRKLLRSQINWLPRFDEITVWSSSLLPREQLVSQVTDLLAARAFFQPGEKIPRTAQAFHLRLEDAAQRIGLATQDVAKLLPKLFQEYHHARLAIEQDRTKKHDAVRSDIMTQMDELFAGDFLVETPWGWLTEYPRYLRAIPCRLDRLNSGNFQRDQAAMTEIQTMMQAYREQYEHQVATDAWNEELTTYRFMLEEYRVSCFAQTLGTSVSVSPKRLEKQWQKALRG